MIHFIFSQSYMFLISSDYERADWKDMIREQQKKCRQQDTHHNKYTINLFSFAKCF